jgi:hypothetical protein
VDASCSSKRFAGFAGLPESLCGSGSSAMAARRVIDHSEESRCITIHPRLLYQVLAEARKI